ncbi:MAG TPA: hypothetical protein VES01_05245 [Dermatophilaceae bacterium]|nr:hypothetical protein [Dermatophilaceae bacterium]
MPSGQPLRPVVAIRRRFGWLWVPGAVVILAGAAALAVGVWSLLVTVGGVTSGLLVGDGQPLAVDLQKGDERTFWVERGAPRPSCRVVDPTGRRTSPVDGASVNVESNGRAFEAIGNVTATVTGVHVIDCAGGSARVSEGSVTGGIVRGVLGILLGALTLVGGIIVTVGALVGWGAMRRRSGR